MKTLVISDIHNRIDNIESVIESFPADQVVFLGDYFDSFNEQEHTEVAIARKTALWLKEMIYHGHTMLFGNHDMSYIFPKTCMCPGWQKSKFNEVRSIITWDDWMELEPLICIDEIWLSHAGMHKSLFSHPHKGFDGHDAQALCREAIESIKGNVEHAVFGWGSGRGGPYPYGGVTWLDWQFLDPMYYANGKPVKQLVGHTPDRIVRQKHDSTLTCIDTSLRYVAIITDGHLEIHETDI